MPSCCWIRFNSLCISFQDIDIVPAEKGQLRGTVASVTFKGVHYDTIVDFKGFKWLIQFWGSL